MMYVTSFSSQSLYAFFSSGLTLRGFSVGSCCSLVFCAKLEGTAKLRARRATASRLDLRVGMCELLLKEKPGKIKSVSVSVAAWKQRTNNEFKGCVRPESRSGEKT